MHKQPEISQLTRNFHQSSSRGRGGAVASGVFGLRNAESYSIVHRAFRCEETPLGAVHRRPQQIIGEKCGLEVIVSSAGMLLLSFTFLLLAFCL